MSPPARPARTTPIELDWRLPVAWLCIVLAAFAGWTFFLAILIGAPLAVAALVFAFWAWVRADNAGVTFVGPVLTLLAAGATLVGCLVWSSYVESQMFPA